MLWGCSKLTKFTRRNNSFWWYHMFNTLLAARINCEHTRPGLYFFKYRFYLYKNDKFKFNSRWKISRLVTRRLKRGVLNRVVLKASYVRPDGPRVSLLTSHCGGEIFQSSVDPSCKWSAPALWCRLNKSEGVPFIVFPPLLRFTSVLFLQGVFLLSRLDQGRQSEAFFQAHYNKKIRIFGINTGGKKIKHPIVDRQRPPCHLAGFPTLPDN